MVKLNDLPPEVLEILFIFLDPTSVTSVSEVCTKFNEIVSESERLMKKLTLHLRFPLDLTGFTDSISRSNRRYRKLEIVKSRDRVCDAHEAVATERLFRQLGGMIYDLKVDWSNSLRPREASLLEIMNRRRGVRVAGVRAARGLLGDHFENAIAAQAQARDDVHNEFVQIFRHFTNVKKVCLVSVHLERGLQPGESSFTCPRLRHLIVSQCDAFCFDLMSSCNQLQKLEVTDPWWNQRSPGIDNFEQFLVSQTSLKDLHMKNFQYPRLFHVDRTAEIRFKLETLVLKSVFFAEKDIANSFFRSQNEIKFIDFQLHNEKVRCLDEMTWYSNILRSIVSNNTHLQTLKLQKLRYKIENYGFLSSIRNPANVKNLTFKVTAEDKSSELFKVFIRMFPNLESVEFKAEESEETDCGICFDEGTVLEHVSSLAITNSSVRSLVNVFAGALTNFEYVPGKTGEFIDDLFGGFFHRHRNIKHLSIGSRIERSYFFVSYNLCQLIVNFLTQLESITIYNFGEVNKSVKLLCNLRRLKTLTLSTEDYQQFTAKTKVECARNDLKLINVDIPNHEEV